MTRMELPRHRSMDSPSASVDILPELEASSVSEQGDQEDGHGLTTRPSFPISLPPHEDEDEEEEVGLTMDILKSGAPVPPDGGYGWVIVFASFICNLVQDGITSTFGVTLPDMSVSFDTGKGNVAWAGSLLCGCSLLMGPIVGALTNKFGCRIVCICGGLIASMGFIISSFATSLPIMLLSYGLLGGIGFGMIYLPAIVCVGYYFESKRALATGIAVCGSGFGAISFAPIASWILRSTDWRSINLIFAALLFTCSLCGGLMRPLEIRREAIEEVEEHFDDEAEGPNRRHLLLRMAEDKHQRKSGEDLYFMVQLPDGTMEKRLKIPPNVDPGVHSSYNLDFDPMQPTTPLPVSPVHPHLETINESVMPKVDSDKPKNPLDIQLEHLLAKMESSSIDSDSVVDDEAHVGSGPKYGGIAHRKSSVRERDPLPSNDEPGVHSRNSSSFKDCTFQQPSLMTRSFKETGDPVSPGHGSTRVRKISFGEEEEGTPSRNGSVSQFYYGSTFSKDGSFGGRERKYSLRAVPSSPTTKKAPTMPSRNASFASYSKRGSTPGFDEDCSNHLLSKGELSGGLIFKSMTSLDQKIIRPLSRKDIFYSGSMMRIPEYQSNVSMYRQSIISLPHAPADEGDKLTEKPIVSPCLRMRPGAFKTALASLMDFSMLKNPVFLLIAISGVVGMLGFYTPFVYIIDFCVTKGIERESAAFLISIIGIMNTVGRVGFGMISDLPQVNSLYVYNVCVLFMGLSTAAVSFCSTLPAIIAVYVCFGLSLSGYISLTSIILVDLLGLDNLTKSFGLLIFFRGVASIFAAPLAGAIYDHFQSYDIPFYLSGGFMVVSALIVMAIPFVTKFAPRKPLEPLRKLSLGVHLEDIPEAREPTSKSNSVSGTEDEHLHIELPSSDKPSPVEESDNTDADHVIQFK